MTARRASAVALVVAVFVAAAAAAIALNLLLLGRASAQNEPIGRLSPRANLPPAPSWTIRPTHAPAEREHDGNDD